jgi:hypothetical protein
MIPAVHHHTQDSLHRGDWDSFLLGALHGENSMDDSSASYECLVAFGQVFVDERALTCVSNPAMQCIRLVIRAGRPFGSLGPQYPLEQSWASKAWVMPKWR